MERIAWSTRRSQLQRVGRFFNKRSHIHITSHVHVQRNKEKENEHRCSTCIYPHACTNGLCVYPPTIIRFGFQKVKKETNSKRSTPSIRKEHERKRNERKKSKKGTNSSKEERREKIGSKRSRGKQRGWRTKRSRNVKKG
jgi:hypothetical protein